MSEDKKTIESCARCFIKRIGSVNRRAKQVDLLHKSWDCTLTDPVWVNGALSTTALRKRPRAITEPMGSLGYKAAEVHAIKAAGNFYRTLTDNKDRNFAHLFSRTCQEFERKILHETDLYWNFGRSQKFFNILTKYWFCMAMAYPERLRGFDRELILKTYSLFHAPVDSITLRHLKKVADGLQLDGIYWGWNMTEQKYGEIQDRLVEIGRSKAGSAIAYEVVEIW